MVSSDTADVEFTGLNNMSENTREKEELRMAPGP